ncbi:MAG: alpha/beta fold hydrolase [Patescibacteria group bacterium]|nr:MAG: alpha/beta fold hydrolase [Patescibacteria group bacterium]
MKKLFIKNRHQKDICVLVGEKSSAKGLAFVMHGLGGFKEQDHIRTLAEALLEKGYTVVSFDTTNSIGESSGRYEEATVTNYYEDLEDVVAWSKNQAWYQEPFIMAGQSLGGICICLYAEKYPQKVLALAPISTVTSGKLSLEAHQKYKNEQLINWQKTGWLETKSESRPGLIKRLPWSHMIDRLKYDLTPEALKLTMPKLLIVGEHDTSTPPEHVKQFFDILPEPKEYHVIKDAPHTFRKKEHLDQIKKIILDWLNKI